MKNKRKLFKNTLYTRKKPQMMVHEKSKSAQNNFGIFIHQFQTETKTLIKKSKRILKL